MTMLTTATLLTADGVPVLPGAAVYLDDPHLTARTVTGGRWGHTPTVAQSNCYRPYSTLRAAAQARLDWLRLRKRSGAVGELKRLESIVGEAS